MQPDAGSVVKVDGGSAQRLDLFPVPVWRARIPDHAEIDRRLKELVWEERRRSPGLQRANRGGWHSRQVVHRWKDPGPVALFAHARALAQQMVAEVNPDLRGLSPDGWSVTAWAAVNSRHDSFRAHTHLRTENVVLSGVYYVDAGAPEGDAPRGGDIVFVHRTRLPLRVRPALLPQEHRVAPETGTLLLFPSWLPHRVEPYLGKGERIAIAFNLSHEAISVAWSPAIRAGLRAAKRIRRLWKRIGL